MSSAGTLLPSARRESESAFGDGNVYLEKLLENARHMIQILADTHGNVIHLGERECSIQRRHQKLLDEAPSAALDDNLRQKMGSVAVKAAEAVDYANAGLYAEAIEVLDLFLEQCPTKPRANPLVYYYRAYYHDRAGSSEKAAADLELAARQSADFCFPFQHEAEPILRYAIAKNPGDSGSSLTWA